MRASAGWSVYLDRFTLLLLLLFLMLLFLFFCFVLAKLYRMVCLPGQVYIVVVCGLVVVVFVVASSLWKFIRILENRIKLTKTIQGAGLSDLQLSHSGPAKLLRWGGYPCFLTSRKGLRRRKRYKNKQRLKSATFASSHPAKVFE